MTRGLDFFSRNPLEVFEYWDRIPEGSYEEWSGSGWLHRTFSEPVQTRYKKGKILSIYNGKKGFFRTPEYTFFREDAKTIKVFLGEKTIFSVPKETYVITATKIEIYDGDNGFFSTPRKVVERKEEGSGGEALFLLSLLSYVLFGIG